MINYVLLLIILNSINCSPRSMKNKLKFLLEPLVCCYVSDGFFVDGVIHMYSWQVLINLHDMMWWYGDHMWWYDDHHIVIWWSLLKVSFYIHYNTMIKEPHFPLSGIFVTKFFLFINHFSLSEMYVLQIWRRYIHVLSKRNVPNRAALIWIT